MQHMDPLASPLGKQTAYLSRYAPELLFPIARQLKRQELGLQEGALPFVGEDVWNAYELSWLTPSGKPVVALGECRVPAETPCLIESKSLKLYLNSLNQTVFSSPDEVRSLLQRDLSQAAGGPVTVEIRPLHAAPEVAIGYPEGVLLDTLDVACTHYTPAPELICTVDGLKTEETLYSHLLKSNCLVTGQPDWAMVVIRYRGQPIDHGQLLRYLVSYRNHNEFHEQCVERIFCDLMTRCAPEALSVHACYTRRGGLDINPFRQTGGFAPPSRLREVRQ